MIRENRVKGLPFAGEGKLVEYYSAR